MEHPRYKWNICYLFGIDDAIIGAGASLAGGLLGFAGGEDTNAANIEMVKQQEDFQERMRSTAYQTAVKDMEAAGLNPMLAYSQGPAQVPSGASIQLQNPALGLQQGLTSAGSAIMQQASLDQLKSSSTLNQAQAIKAAADTQNSLNSASQAAAQTKSILADLPGQQNRASVEKSMLGKGATYFDRVMESLGHLNPFVSSASGAKASFAPVRPAIP